MNMEKLYILLDVMMDYVGQRDKETALFAILGIIYENDWCDIIELKNYADSEENDWMVRKIVSYIKQNGLDETEDEDEW